MQATVEIQNLKCGGCEATILKKLGLEKRLRNVAVDVGHSRVSFEYDNEHALQEAYKALDKLGYPVRGVQNTLSKKAKSFISCAVGRMAK